MDKITYRIHYTEKGHGKMINGRKYQGKRYMDVTRLTENQAIKYLKSTYIEDGIRSIDKVEIVWSLSSRGDR